MHIHRERVDRTQPWDTIYEPRTLSSPHDYGVPSLRVSPDGILNFSRLAAPVAGRRQDETSRRWRRFRVQAAC